MLYKTNILALVGGGEVPKFSPNKITIWDDHQCKIVSQIRFNSEVIKVKIRKDSIIGVIYDKIYILNIFTLEIIDIFQTYENPNGVFSCSNINNDLIMAFPNSQGKGKVQIEQYFITYEANKKNEAKIINELGKDNIEITSFNDNLDKDISNNINIKKNSVSLNINKSKYKKKSLLINREYKMNQYKKIKKFKICPKSLQIQYNNRNNHFIFVNKTNNMKESSKKRLCCRRNFEFVRIE